jgi:ACR3 family arsenite transporter
MSVSVADTGMGQAPAITFFERWLTLWVFLCIVVGVALGQ